MSEDKTNLVMPKLNNNLDILSIMQMDVSGVVQVAAKEDGKGDYGSWYRIKMNLFGSSITYYTDEYTFAQIITGEFYSVSSKLEEVKGKLTLIQPVFNVFKMS